MRISRRLALGAIVLALLVGACSTGGGSKPTVKIGSVAFDEAKVMAEIYAQVLEAKGYTVTGRHRPDRALSSLRPSRAARSIFSRSTSAAVCRYEGGTPTSTASQPRTRSRHSLQAKNLSVFAYTPASTPTPSSSVRETATQFNLTKMSDTAAVQDQLTWGLATDCPTNPLCGAPGGALAQYGITAETVAAATLLGACTTPMADALQAGHDRCRRAVLDRSPRSSSTAGSSLEDDLQTQPADNVAPSCATTCLASRQRATRSRRRSTTSRPRSTRRPWRSLQASRGRPQGPGRSGPDLAEGQRLRQLVRWTAATWRSPTGDAG